MTPARMVKAARGRHSPAMTALRDLFVPMLLSFALVLTSLLPNVQTPIAAQNLFATGALLLPKCGLPMKRAGMVKAVR